MSRCVVKVNGMVVPNIELRQLYVCPEQRRRGHANVMIKLLCEVCDLLGIKLMLFQVDNQHLRDSVVRKGWLP
eukprot:6424-Eustigmatos_ZCMA.PRE.1